MSLVVGTAGRVAGGMRAVRLRDIFLGLAGWEPGRVLVGSNGRWAPSWIVGWFARIEVADVESGWEPGWVLVGSLV